MSRILTLMGILAAVSTLFGCAQGLPDQEKWEAEVLAAAQAVTDEEVTVQWATRGGLSETRQMEITTEINGSRADAERAAADIEAAVAPVAVRIPVHGAVYITVDARESADSQPYRHWQQQSFDQLAEKYHLTREK